MRRFLLVLVLITSNALSALSAETLILGDEFTGSNGTDLASHSPDTGTSWSEVIDSTGSLDIEIQSNQARASANSSSSQVGYAANPAPSTSDMRVKTTLNTWPTGADDPVGLFLRYQDANNYYACRAAHLGGDPAVWFDKVVAGVNTELNGASQAMAAGDELDCSIVGNAYSIKVDGVEVVTGTDSSISTAGRGGIHFGAYPGWPDADITTNWLLDDFEIYEITLDAERRIW